MPSSLLIITPQVHFGLSLRKGLDSARFDVFSTSDFSESIHFVRKNNCSIVILDAELENIALSVMDIGFALRQVKPEIQFILIVSAGQKLDSASLNPVATLEKPISMLELGSLLGRLSAPAVSPKKESIPAQEISVSERALAETSRLLWLKDVSKAAQHLTRLTLESSAQAALITRQNELWAYAGQLSREAALELTSSIQRYWDAEGESDLLRFVRLQATEAQHMLYARKLSENLILALVFDAETPFSTIRAQAGKLVKNLSETSFIELGKSPAPVELAETHSPVVATVGVNTTDSGDEENDLPPISELLGDVPPPIPPRAAPRSEMSWGQSPARESVQVMVSEEKPVVNLYAPRIEKPQPAEFSRESSPPIRRDTFRGPLPAMDETFASPVSSSEVDVKRKTGGVEIPDDLQATRKQAALPDPQSLIETRVHVVNESMAEVAHRITIEPASPAMAFLAYSCLLLPRFDHHHLVGDFAARLNDWVPQTCVAYGWRLEHISVRPEYLQWVVRVPPTTAAGHVLRIIRQQTSEKIFTEFPRFKSENPSGDFWAPGYLIVGSSELPPQTLVRDYISQTRTRQGLNIH